MNFFPSRLYNHDFPSLVVAIAYAITATIIQTNEHTNLVLATAEIRHGFQANELLSLLGVGKSHKKQADLSRKLELAKQQQILNFVPTNNVTTTKSNIVELKHGDGAVSSDDERLEMERSEFSLLLAQYKPPIDTQDAFRSSQIPVEFKAKKPLPKVRLPKKAPSKKDAPTRATVTPSTGSTVDDVPLQVGDKAHRIHFETLMDVRTKQPLGSMGAAKLVPWVPPFIHRNIIIVADPRKQSSEFRAALQYLESSQKQKETSSNIVAITADTSDEVIAYVQHITHLFLD
jgi:hypothetical protein